uniref:Uncharacterized protein n=1 Tax=Rhizophora mucronata TaxID=61149 RepID=A0A2P2P2T8_RHIMU
MTLFCIYKQWGIVISVQIFEAVVKMVRTKQLEHNGHFIM